MAETTLLSEENIFASLLSRSTLLSPSGFVPFQPNGEFLLLYNGNESAPASREIHSTETFSRKVEMKCGSGAICPSSGC